jgi:hypothetical protein
MLATILKGKILRHNNHGIQPLTHFTCQEEYFVSLYCPHNTSRAPKSSIISSNQMSLLLYHDNLVRPHFHITDSLGPRLKFNDTCLLFESLFIRPILPDQLTLH